ncbi:cortactin-binding protein 2-like [Mercenaria mercenaria]|uniref:cortactin-binding protein 2-like n=1 Tax=Mercenaria mercenaria TaxID=6596 RepID=UPI00234F03AA|nr:cortactin-binding protein 2-like [Mercenaria mercenaria]
MAGRNIKPNTGGFDSPDKVNSNTLKRHPKMDLSRNDLLQLLSYLEGELQARDVVIATLKAEKAKQLLYQAKYGRFGLGDPFSAMQRDSDNMKDNTFDESAIKSMYDNQLAQLENLIATQRKAQMKMREQMIIGEKRYHKVHSELEDEKRKHAQDTAQGDDVTYMLEKERERLTKEIDFEKANQKKMEKDMKKTLASLEDERASSAKHKQVALMLIKERKKLVEKLMQEKFRAEQAERILQEERSKSMNMAEGLVQESKKSLKMEATMERQLSEFDLEREQLKNKLHREENRNKDLSSQIDSLTWQLENLQKQLPGKYQPKELVHSVEIKSTVSSPQTRLSSERTWPASNQPVMTVSGKGGTGIVEREAGLSPRTSSSELSVRKRDNIRYASPPAMSLDRGHIHYTDNIEQRVAPVGAVAESKLLLDSHGSQKLNVGGPNVVSSGGRITVQTGSLVTGSGQLSPRRGTSVGRGTPPPIPPNKPVLPTTTTATKPVMSHKTATLISKDGRAPGSKPVHIPVSVVHTSTVTASPGSRTPKREGSPSTLRKPAQFSDDPNPVDDPIPYIAPGASHTPPTSDSFDFLGQEMADLQQLLVSMVTVPSNSPGVSSEIQSSAAPSLSTSTSSATTSVSFVEGTQLTSSLTSQFTPLVTSQVMSSSIFQESSISSQGISSTSPISSSLASQGTSLTASMTFQRTSIGSPVTSEVSPVTSQKILNSSMTSSQNKPVSQTSKLPVRLSTVSVTSASSSAVASLPQATGIPVGDVNFGRRSLDTEHLSDIKASLSSADAGRRSLDSAKFSDVMTASTVSTKIPVVKDTPSSPIHRYAATGNVDALRKLIVDLEADVNLPMKDGTTPAHCAAENGQEECLSLLIKRGCHVNSLRDDQQTPVHCAAAQGHIGCLRLLLTNGGNPNLADHSGWSPLHWAASNGHLECCRRLLSHGAKRLCCTNTFWTPFHLAVHSSFPHILELLLTFEVEKFEILAEVKQSLFNIVDKDGGSLGHLAASKESHECLTVILTHCDIDTDRRDKWGRTILDVSSPSCRSILLPYVNKGRLKNVRVELRCTGPLYAQQEPFVVGNINILPKMMWNDVDLILANCVETYLDQIDHGLRTKKISRLDPENNGDDNNFTLELNADSICGYTLGSLTWNREGPFPNVSLQQVVGVLENPSILVNLKGSSNDLDSLAFDLLLPVSAINNYTRLLDQYKCVVFYGPEGTRKKQLVKRLARHIADKEFVQGVEARSSQVYLHRDFKHRDFLHLLSSEGCILPVGINSARACILTLFHLEKVHLAEMLGSLLEHIEHRGSQHTFTVRGAGDARDLYYFPQNFYLIATMDKPRSTGLDLGLQQRFRWVHFRVKVEPIKNLLGRHLLRRLLHTYSGELPSADDSVFKVVEWLLCVWQRLNDGVSKLGLPDVVFGPDMFMPCPIESRDAKNVLDWMQKLWNETISPAVKTAVLKGTGKDSTKEGQQKVANTALYVLMQRAIVPGCPLNGQEKDEYLSTFCGSNELDVSLKSEKQSPASSSVSQRRSLHNGNHRNNLEVNQSRSKHRNSTDGNFQFTNATLINNNNNTYKRRSLSEDSLMRTHQIEIPVIHDSRDQQQNDIQAKVPKLEIRSPILGLTIPLHSTLPTAGRTSPLSSLSTTSGNHGASHRRSTFSSHSRIPQPSSKRSKSSENLSASNLQGNGQFRPTSPFSFSLATPTPSLFSFKFYDDKSSKKVQKFDC